MMDSNKIDLQGDAEQVYIQLTELAKSAREKRNMRLYATILKTMRSYAKDNFLDDEFLTSTRYI